MDNCPVGAAIHIKVSNAESRMLRPIFEGVYVCYTGIHSWKMIFKVLDLLFASIQSEDVIRFSFPNMSEHKTPAASRQIDINIIDIGSEAAPQQNLFEKLAVIFLARQLSPIARNCILVRCNSIPAFAITEVSPYKVRWKHSREVDYETMYRSLRADRAQLAFCGLPLRRK